MKQNKLRKSIPTSGKKIFCHTLFILALLIFAQTSANAATFTVTNTNNSGAGSLRQAIIDANATTADDTITFNIAGCPNGVCTITLTSGELTINAALTAGKLTVTNSTGASNLLISGNNTSRVFFVKAGADATLEGITITGGTTEGDGGGVGVEFGPRSNLAITNSIISRNSSSMGGGISNITGTLIITNSTISNNSARNGGGGIYNISSNAAVTLINSAVRDNSSNGYGGGINNRSFGTVTLTDSIISNNVAPQQVGGGGIFNEGTLAVTNSTISGNSAPSQFGVPIGGGIINFRTATLTNSTVSGNSAYNGGAIFNSTGSALTITNSTISGNSARVYGGAIFNGGTITVTNSTISANSSVFGGGGIRNESGIVNLLNTIVAGNTDNSATAPDFFREISSTSSFNIIGNGQGMTGITNGTNNNQVGTNANPINARLAPLGNYGGPTQTHALLAGSPAINAGNNCVLTANGCGNGNTALTTDQRGFPRNGQVDIGAFELQANENTFPKVQFDFDGDGRADASVFRSGTWYVNRSTQGFLAVQFGLASDKLAPADYDGDGKTDVAVWRDEPGNPDRANFYILNSATGTVRVEQFGRTGDSPAVVGDWDNDGKADLAVYRNGTNIEQSYFFYRPSSQTTVDFVSIPWGVAGDLPMRGDFDGDGKFDAAVFRPSNNVWYILQSSNLQVRYDRWGLATDKFVPADYDGDGKTDLAIFRGGVWHIKQSSNNQPAYKYLGVTGDTLVPADYDGDGRTDAAVFRNGIFYILQNAANQPNYLNFGLPGDAPIASIYVQ